MPPALARIWRSITRPVMAIVIFNGVLLFTHWPAVVTASVGSEPLHLALHTLIVLSALIMWWPVFSPLPEMPPISPPGQILYLFVQSLAPTIPASFLTFGHQPLYQVYDDVPAAAGRLGDDRPADRGPDHEDRRRADPVGLHRGDLLPVGRRASASRAGTRWRMRDVEAGLRVELTP